MPDKWIKIKDRRLDTGLFAGGKIEILETGIHPTRNRKLQPIIQITHSLGNTDKIHLKDCIDIIGFYHKHNPPVNTVSAIIDIENMNIAKCKMTDKNEITCKIMER